MMYRGYFTDASGIQWRVEMITGNNTDQTTVIRLSHPPVSIVYSGSDNPLDPLKISGVTINCWVDNYMFDLFSGSANGVRCDIYKGADLFWKGYATPNLYDQPYNRKKFELQVECLDCLSTTSSRGYHTQQIGIKSFAKIIDDIIKRAGITGKVYVSDFSDKKLSDLYINEQNFYDEYGDPMTDKEVLESILQYFVITAMQVGNDVYIVNYSLLARSHEAVFVEYVNGYHTAIKTINTRSLLDKCSDATLSLSGVYNAVSAQTSLYPFDDIADEVFEKKNLIKRALNSGAIYTYKNSAKETWTHVVTYLDMATESGWRVKSYNRNATVTSDQCIPGNIETNKFWTQIVKCGGWDSGKSATQPADLNLGYYIMSKYIQGAKGSNNIFNSPIVEYRDDRCITLQGGFFVINCDVFFCNQALPYLPEYASNHQPNFNGVNIGYRNPSVVALLKIGDKYWNGTSWTDTFSTFTITFGEGYKGTKRFNNWLSITDTNKASYGVSGKGHYIPIPDTSILYGSVYFYICQPEDYYMEYNSQIDYIFIRNITIEHKYKIPESYSLSEEEADTDTIYQAMISADNVQDMESLDLRVCTNNGKGNSKASVMQLVDGKYSFINSLKSNSLGKTQLQEDNILEEYIGVFSQPKKVISIESKGLIAPYATISEENDTYIVGSVEYNCSNNRTIVKLFEK